MDFLLLDCLQLFHTPLEQSASLKKRDLERCSRPLTSSITKVMHNFSPVMHKIVHNLVQSVEIIFQLAAPAGMT
jgi:hypothetical protein